MADFGVITEQGYPAGQFGFKPITEDEKKSIENTDKKDDKKSNNKE